MADRPRIGVVSDYHAGTLENFGGDEAHHFLNARYTRAVEAAGGLPWLLPIPERADDARDYVAALDGLLMTGCGRHTDPRAYGEEPLPGMGACMAPEKERFEIKVFRAARQAGLPVLAICGGMQNANVAQGGSLVQRITEQVPNALDHMQTSKAIHTVHEVRVKPGTRLAEITAMEQLETNSSHTQAIGRVGAGLTVTATSADGVVEALEGTTGPWLVAVQWHPEYLFTTHPEQARLFAAFLDACRTS